MLIVENIGNLVCPAEFNIGEDMRVAILSVPEGEDKKEKYPWIKQLSIAGLLAAGILNIVDDKPVSDLFTYNKK